MFTQASCKIGDEMEDGRGDGLFAFDVPSCSAFLNTSPGSNSKQKLTVKSH